MASTSSSDVKLEIGHVLFIDIVGYSKLLITDQSELLQKLKEIVWGTEQFRLAQAEGKLLRLPTGDGGALVFRNNPEAPVMLSYGVLKLFPVWDPLRGDPRLEQIVASLAPKKPQAQPCCSTKRSHVRHKMK